MVERRGHSSVLDVPSFRGADCDTYHCLVAAEVRERLSVSKRETQKFYRNRFNVKSKMKKLEITVRLISHICVALEDIYDFGDLNRASENGENIKKYIKNSAKHSLFFHKQKHCKPSFDDEFSVRIIVGVNLNLYNSVLSVYSSNDNVFNS